MRGSALERFIAKVQIDDPDGCWTWGGGGSGRYGTLWVDDRDVKAHRFAYETAYGPVPDGTEVCHRCDNSRCVRPSHLFIGTHADNMADMVVKGRSSAPRGMAHHAAKLSDEDVRAIRRDPRPYRAIAADYGMSTVNVGLIKRMRTWAHVA